MGIFRKNKVESRADTNAGSTNNNLGLDAFIYGTEMTKANALQVPSVTAAIDKLASTVAKLPVKLYKNDSENGIVEVTDDRRTFLLNVDTGDTLTTVDFWKALIEDYYVGKGAYFYINKEQGQVKSIHYVDESRISVNPSQNAIFKDCDIYIDGVKYYPFDFVKIMRKTKDGCTSKPITEENSKILAVAYDSLKFESNIVKKGGNKKGFFKAASRLDKDSIAELKEAIINLYSNNDSDRAIVLNNGMDFKETSATSVEMQLNENKLTNADEIFKIFGFPTSIVKGGATQQDKDTFIETVTSLLNAIEAALDKDFLLEKEKGSFYFAFDTKELTRGNIKERFEAYGVALDKHFMQTDEVRKLEDLEPIGFNFVKLGLGDVLYNPETKEVFVPNTGTNSRIDENSLTNGEDDNNIPESELSEQRANPNHGKDGKFTSGGKNNNKSIDNSNSGGIIKSSPKISATGENKFERGFSKKNLDKHWDGSSSHKDQYKNMTKKQYSERALELIQKPVGGDIKGYKNNLDEIVRYDVKNNDFVKGNPAKGIKTMFKPSSGEKYYIMQEKRGK